ncbi:hypothetical protein [Streptomyces sp. NRRL S-495]|uniref:hypothetical protein n=1 Tax=Streptomyces sp. NRRL S-495 TaxID=1609133 RepID=UPI0005F8C937|nr:hypothetical protein [Streptomyces sp. NRRL S-495]KJY32156.1 hypothetical protein VR45_23355 [Streptomyces sp. NRRL S-495]
MAVDYTDNPAGRLRSLLLSLHDLYRARGEMVAWEAMAELLQEPASSPQALIRYADVLRLPGEIRDAVASLDFDEEDKEHLLEHLDRVELALVHAGRHNGLTGVLSMFAPAGEVPNSAAVQSLQTCSRTLHRHVAEHELDEEALERITATVTGLMEDVLAAPGLDSDIKRLLLTHLRSILEAVQNVRVTGQGPVEEATDALVGAIARRPSVITRLRGFGNLLPRVRETVDVVNAALAMEQDANRLVHNVMDAITS